MYIKREPTTLTDNDQRLAAEQSEEAADRRRGQQRLRDADQSASLLL
jgi:hypothetical protein